MCLQTVLRLMVRVSLVLSVCLRMAAATEVHKGTSAYLDDQYGFGDVHFGDQVDAVKHLKKAGERGECEVAYTRPKDTLTFAGVPLTGIEYSFQNDRLTVVSLLAKDDQCLHLYDALTTAYGADVTKLGATAASKPFWSASWAGQRVRLDITGPAGCTVTITAPEEAVLEERRCREDDRVKAGTSH